MNFSKVKKGLFLVDRWYSYSANSYGIQGRGEVVKVSRKKNLAEIKFENGKVVTYDSDHIKEFMMPWKKGMKRKYNNSIIPALN